MPIVNRIELSQVSPRWVWIVITARLACLFSAGKSLKDTDKLSDINVDKTGKIYFKDLGPQIGWSTVSVSRH